MTLLVLGELCRLTYSTFISGRFLDYSHASYKYVARNWCCILMCWILHLLECVNIV